MDWRLLQFSPEFQNLFQCSYQIMQECVSANVLVSTFAENYFSFIVIFNF